MNECAPMSLDGRRQRDVGRPEAHLGVIGFVAAAAAVDPALGRSPRSLLGRADVLLANGRIENVQ
jgi:hypothetical protein